MAGSHNSDFSFAPASCSVSSHFAWHQWLSHALGEHAVHLHFCSRPLESSLVVLLSPFLILLHHAVCCSAVPSLLHAASLTPLPSYLCLDLSATLCSQTWLSSTRSFLFDKKTPGLLCSLQWFCLLALGRLVFEVLWILTVSFHAWLLLQGWTQHLLCENPLSSKQREQSALVDYKRWFWCSLCPCHHHSYWGALPCKPSLVSTGRENLL